MTKTSQQARRNAGIIREEAYLHRIQQRYDALSEREHRVADVLLLNAHEKNLEYTISSLAEEAAVSEATVTRFCRALGFSGFREFKYHAMKHEPQQPFTSGTQVTERDNLETVSGKVAALIEQMTRRSVEGLDRRAAEAAVDILCGAETILFVGGGSAAGVAASSAAVFQNMGMKALTIADDLLMFRYIACLTERDAVVCISNEGYLKTVVDAAMMARRHRVPTIVITATAGSLLTRYADCLLLTSAEGFGGTVDLYAVLTAQMAVLNVLQLGCLLRKGGEIEESRLQNIRITETKRYDTNLDRVGVKRMRQ